MPWEPLAACFYKFNGSRESHYVGKPHRSRFSDLPRRWGSAGADAARVAIITSTIPVGSSSQSRVAWRKPNAFSKKWENYWAAVALWFAFYNFCRGHRSLRVTPATEAKVTDHIWSVAGLPEAARNGRNAQMKTIAGRWLPRLSVGLSFIGIALLTAITILPGAKDSASPILYVIILGGLFVGVPGALG